MKLKITKDHDFRLRPAARQAFRAGQIVSVPKSTATALIEAGVAETYSSKDMGNGASEHN